MKVGIVGFANLRYMPYLRYYTDTFDQNGIEYEIIYWDRRGLTESWNSETFVFKERLEDSAQKLSKIGAMIRFGSFAQKVLRNRQYDFLIILTTLPVMLLGNYIKHAYPERYLVDIRDYTYERFFIYRNFLKRILSKAAMRVISSPAFRSFLPECDYTVCHNFSVPTHGDRNIRAKKPRSKNVINISYIGAIAYYHEVVKFINVIANDRRFAFSIYGSGVDEQALTNYCVSNGINNIKFHGIYQPDEKELFYGETDLIFSAYGNSSLLTKYALSNKLYDAAWYRIPIIVSPSTAMSKMAGGLGFGADYSDHKIADRLYKWYIEMNWEKFNLDSDILIDSIIEVNRKFKEELLSVLYLIEGK